jgi:hypothetical protein
MITYVENWNSHVSQWSLMDKINQISNYIHRDTLLGGAKTVIMTQELHDSLALPVINNIQNRYNGISIDNDLGDKVIVKFDELIQGEVRISNKPLKRW